MNTIEIEGKHYEITGYAEDGLPIIRAAATSTKDGYDKDGNPRISVNITVPPVLIGVTPGEVQ